MGGIASASYHVTMLRACALMSGFADVLPMLDCSFYFACTTSVHNATSRAWTQICSATVSLSTGSNAVGDAFWSNLFCDDTVSCTSLFDYFLCSLQWRQLHVKLPNFLNDCDAVEFGAYMCALTTTSLIASDAELPFGTCRHGLLALRTLDLQYR